MNYCFESTRDRLRTFFGILMLVPETVAKKKNVQVKLTITTDTLAFQ